MSSALQIVMLPLLAALGFLLGASVVAFRLRSLLKRPPPKVSPAVQRTLEAREKDRLKDAYTMQFMFSALLVMLTPLTWYYTLFEPEYLQSLGASWIGGSFNPMTIPVFGYIAGAFMVGFANFLWPVHAGYRAKGSRIDRWSRIEHCVWATIFAPAYLIGHLISRVICLPLPSTWIKVREGGTEPSSPSEDYDRGHAAMKGWTEVGVIDRDGRVYRKD